MYKIAVIGDRDSIYGFATLGLDVYPADDEQTGRTLFRRIVEGEYAVAYITEKLAAKHADEIEKLRFRPLPAVILIPGVSGNTGLGIQNVRSSVEKAVGSDIIFGEQ